MIHLRDNNADLPIKEALIDVSKTRRSVCLSAVSACTEWRTVAVDMLFHADANEA